MGINKFKSIDDASLWEILKEVSEKTGISVEKLTEEVIGINEGLKSVLEKLPAQGAENFKREILKSEFDKMEEQTSRAYKLSIILGLYKKFKTSKNPVNKELKRLFLDGAKYIFTIRPNVKGNFDYEIITKDKKQGFEELELPPNLKDGIEDIFDEIVDIPDLQCIVKDDYDPNTIIDKMFLELATEKGLIDMKNSFDKDKDNTEVLVKIKEGLKEKIESNKEYVDEIQKNLSSYIKENMQFIDMNKFLLMSATRLIIGMRIASGETIEDITLAENVKDATAKDTIDLIEQIKKELKERTKRNSKVKNLNQTLYNSKDEVIINVNLEYIDTFLKRCIDNRYVTDDEIAEVHKELVENGKMPSNPKMCVITGISEEDLKNIGVNAEKEKDAQKKKVLMKGAKDLIKYLKEKQTLSDEKIMEMYIDGELPQELVLDIDFESEYYINMFKKLYEENSIEETVEKTKRLNRFSNLCDKLSEQEKLDKETLLLEFMESNDKENVYELYTMGAISLEECFECIGIEALEKIFSGGNITVQPAILKKLYDNGNLNIDNMVNLINRIPTQEEKYLLIINIFPEELEIRQNIISKTLEVDTGLTTKAITKNKRKTNDPKEEEDIYKKHITDSAYRFNLIKNLDVNYYMEMTKDGHVLLTLPKFKKIIIEKILDTQNENGYGAATYVLDENYFKNNKAKITNGGKINRSGLVEFHKAGNATKFSHSVKSWGDKIKKFFEKTSGIPFTDDENKKLDEIIKKIKESEKLI